MPHFGDADRERESTMGAVSMNDIRRWAQKRWRGAACARGLWSAPLALVCAAAPGCGSADAPTPIGGSAVESSDGSGASGDGASAEGTARSEGAPTPLGESSPGAADLLGDEPSADSRAGGSCGSRLAAETFTSAVCSCEDTNVAGYLKTASFASSRAAASDLEGDTASDGASAAVAPGSVSVNGNYATGGYADVQGSFTVAGDRDIAFGGYLKAGEDVRVSPALRVAGVVEVGRDAFLKRDARVFGRVEIGRDLYLDAGVSLNGLALVDVGGQRRAEEVSIAEPCACAGGQVIDVGALVAAAENDNDNARVGLDPDALNALVGIGAEATLPGGRYFIHQLGGLGSVTLHVAGKTALFVADDVVAAGVLRVELEPDAELDLFVRDNLLITGAALFGDPERPSATRIYVGGTGDVAIAGASAFVGNLYAPSANILIGGVGRVDGALFGKNVVAAGFLDLGYDASIRDAGEQCPPLLPSDIPRIR